MRGEEGEGAGGVGGEFGGEEGELGGGEGGGVEGGGGGGWGWGGHIFGRDGCVCVCVGGEDVGRLGRRGCFLILDRGLGEKSLED